MVFPDPFLPQNPYIFPVSISRLMSLSIVLPFIFYEYCLQLISYQIVSISMSSASKSFFCINCPPINTVTIQNRAGINIEVTKFKEYRLLANSTSNNVLRCHPKTVCATGFNHKNIYDVLFDLHFRQYIYDTECCGTSHLHNHNQCECSTASNIDRK